MIQFGNDIVDKKHFNIEELFSNFRFQRKVFSSEELEYLSQFSGNSHIEKGIVLWSLKESAYKAISRYNPSVVFAYKSFVAYPDSNYIEYNSTKLYSKVYTSSDYIYSYCIDKKEYIDMACNQIDPIVQLEQATLERNLNYPEDMSQESFLTRFQSKLLLAKSLSLKSDEPILIDRQRDALGKVIPPIAVLPKRNISIPISITHHGRFAASMFVKY